MVTGVQVKKAVCTWCKGECGVLTHVKDGHVIKVEEDPEWPRKVYPPAKGCARLRAAVEWFYHKDRVNYPLKRTGEKGGGKWERIPWDQALDEIAGKLKEIRDVYGAEAVAYTSGTEYRTESIYKGRFFNLFGSPNNINQGQICFGPRTVMGHVMSGMFPHFSIRPVTKCIVLLGVEPLVSRPITGKVLLEAKERGAKLIVFDPRLTRSASMADVWLRLRPGTDCALLMGMIDVIIKEELYDKQFVDEWCFGFEQLKARAAEYGLAKVAAITDVSPEKIVEAARMYAANRPGSFVEGMGVEHLADARDILQARWALSALTGNIDIEGGEELAGAPEKMVSLREVELSEKLSPEQRKKQLGSERFRLYSWPGQELLIKSVGKVWHNRMGGAATFQATAHGPTVYRAIITGKPYPVKAMITSSSNPMVTQGNTKLVHQALKKLDLYVVMDFWMTPSAELADYVLPPASWMERPLLTTFSDYADSVVAGETSVPDTMPGEYEHMGDYEFFRELGIRLGQEEYWPWKTLEEAYDYRLKPMGLTLKEFVDQKRCYRRPLRYRKYLEEGFGTPTGKVELYSTVLEQLGYDPLPRFHEAKESKVSQPELLKEYPLTLIDGGRILYFYHSEWRNIDSVRKLHPEPKVMIHPETAKKYGISEGDTVWIETLRGRIRQKAELFEHMAPDIVHAEFGWSYPELPGAEPSLHGVFDVNVNVLTDDSPEVCDPALGVWPLRTALCKIYKA